MEPLLSLLPSIFLASSALRLWYAVPLVVSVSLVYAATRHEDFGPILDHAWRFALWIFVFMGAIFAVLQLMTWQLG